MAVKIEGLPDAGGAVSNGENISVNPNMPASPVWSTTGDIAMADSPTVAPVPHPTVTRTIEPMSQVGATPIAVEFGIEQSSIDKTFNYSINGRPLDRIPPIEATIGETQIWTVINTTAWSHPLHLHGFFFQVLDKDGKPKRPLQWKDTLSVPFKDRLSLRCRPSTRTTLPRHYADGVSIAESHR